MQLSVGQTSRRHDGGDRPSSLGEPVHTTHTYVLKTGYAFVSIKSHAHNIHDIPLMYLEEETMGTIVFPESHLHEVRSIVVVLQELVSNSVKKVSQTKLVLSSQQVRRSHTSNGEFRWHFAISPSTTAGSSPNHPTASRNSAHRHPSNRDHHQEFRLQITIHRGIFMPKIRMKRSISIIPSPDNSSTRLPPRTITRNPCNLASSWTANRCPPVIVRGVIFKRNEVEVECRLVIPTSYPVSDTIPLRLTMTCENREAMDLFAVPHVFDVRLLKVLAFGRNAAAAAPPFTLRNRTSYHITNWVATALWTVDGHAIYENGRWRIELHGRLIRNPGAEISHIFTEPGLALMYYVCLFPFRSDDFRPQCAPDRILFYGRIPLTE